MYFLILSVVVYDGIRWPFIIHIQHSKRHILPKTKSSISLLNGLLSVMNFSVQFKCQSQFIVNSIVKNMLKKYDTTFMKINNL